MLELLDGDPVTVGIKLLSEESLRKSVPCVALRSKEVPATLESGEVKGAKLELYNAVPLTTRILVR